MTKIGNTLFPRASFIGFDHLFQELEHATNHAYDNYPPHNIVKLTDDEYVIEVAVAGFKKGEITVEQKERSVIINGKHESVDVQVNGATLKDGILAITLKLEIPEEKRPRSIDIK